VPEQFEGPVTVTRPTGKPLDFEVAKFDGVVNLVSNVFVGGGIAARGNVDTEGRVNTGDIKLFGSESYSDPSGAGVRQVTCVLNCPTDDTLSVKHLRAEGNVDAQDVHVKGDVIVSNTDISIRQMAQTLAAIDARTEQMAQTLAAIDDKLDDLKERIDTFRSMTARMPDGRTLINVIGTIEDKVNSL
jgi:hypothetical protein